jgi:hypothetical protein
MLPEETIDLEVALTFIPSPYVILYSLFMMFD